MSATATPPNSCWYARGHSHFIISKIARHVWLEGCPPKKPTCSEVQLFFTCATGGRWVLGAGVDRSVIQRVHTVSIMEPSVVCIRSGWGDTGASQIKTRAANRKQGCEDKTRTACSGLECLPPLPPSSLLTSCNSVSDSGCLFLSTVIKFCLPQLCSPPTASRRWHRPSASVMIMRCA